MPEQGATNAYDRILYKSVGIALDAPTLDIRSGNDSAIVTSSAEVRDVWFEGKHLVLTLAREGGTSSTTIVKGRGSPGFIECDGVGVSANVALDQVGSGFRYLRDADVLIVKVTHATRTPVTIRIGRFP